MIRILASCSPGEIRIVAMDGDTLTDYALWRPGAPDGVGDLHHGRVTARVPAMAGAFVTIANADGFLPDSAGAAGRGAGDGVGVRIVRAAQGGKGPRLTARLTPAEAAQTADGPVRLVARGPGALEILAACCPGAPIWIDNAATLARLRPILGERLRLVASAFEPELEAEIDELAEPEIDLPGGLRASIVPTPALVAIDVDGRAATADRAAKGHSQLQANLGVIPALARQIRLRNLSGAILIDFAGMAARQRAALGPALTAALATDPLRPRLLGFTALGFAEILRQRGSAALHERLAGAHAAGLRGLRQAVRHLAANPRAALTLRASPAILAALQADPAALADYAGSATYPLRLRSDPALPADRFVVEEIHAG